MGPEVTGMVPLGSSNGNSCSQADFALSASDLSPELHSKGRRAGELKMRPHGFTLHPLSVFLAALWSSRHSGCLGYSGAPAPARSWVLHICCQSTPWWHSCSCLTPWAPASGFSELCSSLALSKPWTLPAAPLVQQPWGAAAVTLHRGESQSTFVIPKWNHPRGLCLSKTSEWQAAGSLTPGN